MSTKEAQSSGSKAEYLASLPVSVRKKILKNLTEADAEEIEYDWSWWARPNQLAPEGMWRIWLLLAGRGFGKTKTGAEQIRAWAKNPLPAPIHLIAPTAADVRTVMIEGPSGILSCYPPHERPDYQPSRRQITWPNGNIAITFSADEPERLRGPQCCKFWGDEIAAWRYGQDCWDNLMFGFRIGDDLRGVITTTPKPTKMLREIIASKSTRVTSGSTYENRGNLSAGFFDEIITKYEGTRLGRQELLAELLTDVPGALWTRAMLDATRLPFKDVRFDLLTRVVVAIDPAVTANEDSDETGIIVAALTRSLHVLILDDKSCKESPLGWATAAVDAYKHWQCDRAVGEVNNGGDLVGANLRAVDRNIAFRSVHASRAKTKRAEPVAALYEQGRVHHVGFFPDLEEQMVQHSPKLAPKQRNDRMDALVYAVTELLIEDDKRTITVLVNDPSDYQISRI